MTITANKICRKCGAADRDASGDCRPCSKARRAIWNSANAENIKVTSAAWAAANADRKKQTDSAWNAAHKDKVRANNSAWKRANPGKIQAYQAAHRIELNATAAAWAKANPEKVKAANTAYRAANPDKAKIQSAAYRKANPEKVARALQEWTKAHPESRRIRDQNRRARKLKAGGKLSKGLAAKLFVLQKGKCPCCQKPLGNNYHMDHKMPLALGGDNTDANMQLLTAKCNMQKHFAHPIDFMQSRGFLL